MVDEKKWAQVRKYQQAAIDADLAGHYDKADAYEWAADRILEEMDEHRT